MPYRHRVPPQFSKRRDTVRVPTAVAFEFPNPEFPVGSGYFCSWASWMQMPEASIDEQDLLSGCEREIGSSGKVLAVKTVTITEPMQCPANDHFGFGPFRSHARHDMAAHFRRNVVNHGTVVCSSNVCRSEDAAGFGVVCSRSTSSLLALGWRCRGWRATIFTSRIVARQAGKGGMRGGRR